MKERLNRSSANVPRVKPSRILQFGAGNFLRGFVDRMIDDLNRATDFCGGVIVVKPTEKGDYRELRIQEGLYHVWTNGISGGQLISQIQLVTCINEIIHPYREWERFLESAEEPDIRFVISNTTESGIRFSEEDGKSESCPREFPAKLTRWLYHRYQFFDGEDQKGCILLPCELIVNNGLELKKCLLQYADKWQLEPGFISWLEKSNHFCNTLVDQIIPGAPKNPNDPRYGEMKVEDHLVTTAEPYHLWVIDGPAMLKNELPFDKTGLNVVFTNDVDMYRTRKIRILNGAHTTMVAVGQLYGLKTVLEVMEDNTLAKYIGELIYQEIIPTLGLDGEMLRTFAAQVLDRFRNPYIEHRLETISLNSISKLKVRILPNITFRLNRGEPLPVKSLFAFVSMIWFYRGALNHPVSVLNDSEEVVAFFREAWDAYESSEIDLRDFTRRILANQQFWDVDLSREDRLTEKLSEMIGKIASVEYRKVVDAMMMPGASDLH